MESSTHEVTHLLHLWSEGDTDAFAQLMPLVCDELRGLARRYLHREDRGHTLQPTALVNEVYLRLHGRRQVQWKNRAHFFGFAAQTMRRILVDHARGNKTSKRGGGLRPLPLDEALDVAESRHTDLIALDEALVMLQEMDARQAQIVELRFFVGLTVEECAAVLGIGTATVKREWKLARLWLYRQINGSTPPPE